MFGILLSALNSVLGWVFRSLLVKFVLFFALYFITSEFVGFIAALLAHGNFCSGVGLCHALHHPPYAGDWISHAHQHLHRPDGVGKIL